MEGEPTVAAITTTTGHVADTDDGELLYGSALLDQLDGSITYDKFSVFFRCTAALPINPTAAALGFGTVSRWKVALLAEAERRRTEVRMYVPACMYVCMHACMQFGGSRRINRYHFEALNYYP